MPPPELDARSGAAARTPPELTLTPCRLTLCGPGATPTPTLPQRAAGLGAPQNFSRQQRPVALHFHVDIVLDRQRDHVLRRSGRGFPLGSGIRCGWNYSIGSAVRSAPGTGRSTS